MKYVSLKNRLLLGSFVVCSIITLSISLYQISRLQQREFDFLQNEISAFQQSVMPSIDEALWNYDWAMVKTIASSQTNQVLTYLNICGLEDGFCCSSGIVEKKPFREYRQDIYYQFSPSAQSQKIGTAYLQLHYQPFGQLFKRYIFSEFLVNGLGVFGVAICIFLLFHLGAIRRLIRIANYTRDIDLTAVEKLQPLITTNRGSTMDEVDLLAEAMDGFIGRIKQEFSRRKQLEQQLNHAQKMEALGTLAGGIAHDFNNILAAILGYVQLCYNSAEVGSTTRRRLEQVLLAGDRATALIAQILIFSRKSEKYTQEICLTEIVNEALNLVHASLPGNVTIETDLDNELWMVGDSGQLHQVLLNLATNAGYELAEHGGKIKVSLVSLRLTQQQADKLDLDIGDYICLTFCDNGSGVPKEIRDRIFDPFFTTKETGKGTGMGLAVAHGIVQAHGGRIILEPDVEKGTCFGLYFPQGQAAKKREGSSPDAERAFHVGHEHLLLVDDEPIVIKMGQELLQSLGYHVSTSTSSIAALRQLLETDNIDLLVTDLTMPEMTGIELASKLRQEKPSIPIVLYTGNVDLLDSSVLQDGVIDQLLKKPFKIEDLSRVVRQALDG